MFVKCNSAFLSLIRLAQWWMGLARNRLKSLTNERLEWSRRITFHRPLGYHIRLECNQCGGRWHRRASRIRIIQYVRFHPHLCQVPPRPHYAAPHLCRSATSGWFASGHTWRIANEQNRVPMAYKRCTALCKRRRATKSSERRQQWTDRRGSRARRPNGGRAEQNGDWRSFKCGQSLQSDFPLRCAYRICLCVNILDTCCFKSLQKMTQDPHFDGSVSDHNYICIQRLQQKKNDDVDCCRMVMAFERNQ